MDPNALDDVNRVPHGGTDDPRVIDFSANTNPERPPGVAPVYDAALSVSRRYPADDYGEFRSAAAAYVGCEPKEVIPSAGAMDGMRLLFSVSIGEGDAVLVPEPSFGEYEREIRLQGATPVGIAHDEVVEVDDPSEYDMVVVCNPNNPTGETAETCDLLALAERCRVAGTTLFVDEAFLDFTPRASLAGEPGVVVARSLTKMFGLPGLRAGFLAATGRLRDRLDAARVSWGLSTPATAVGTHCLEQEAFVERTRERVAEERDRMATRLSARWDVYPSDAPYLLFDVGADDPDDVLDAAREAGVVLRDARTFNRLDNHLRTAVRRPAENDRLLDALAV
ncbi:aminotransferase class I/II-fold pyridoxal phosphate-dependent enzyme [Halorubrum sp. JWXQ-INN 858]|uniref:pyridoxal phosphate-dependent aminotransferase n=1 Tax=Halorubrum sp. JWXQ-INN 858 TaxID=2690782 RepID=UPI00135A1365|nr:threonine-phosphate decarboxylase [Halorubrum sp. JWXQ-INN 858]MWV65119.1 aminotransferase class I/II-fold pyridoxal phosphate-dependent enzyme [Halorubrum sp. JWXQ-INN 858]